MTAYKVHSDLYQNKTNFKQFFSQFNPIEVSASREKNLLEPKPAIFTFFYNSIVGDGRQNQLYSQMLNHMN